MLRLNLKYFIKKKYVAPSTPANPVPEEYPEKTIGLNSFKCPYMVKSPNVVAIPIIIVPIKLK